jgi:hypothetical protein
MSAFDPLRTLAAPLRMRIMSVLLIALLLAVAFIGGHTMLRRRDDERLYNRTTLALVALTFAVVFSIIAAIHLGLITDHYP